MNSLDKKQECLNSLSDERIKNELNWANRGSIAALYADAFSSFCFYKGLMEASKITQNTEYAINNPFLYEILNTTFLKHIIILIYRFIEKKHKNNQHVITLKTIIEALTENEDNFKTESKIRMSKYDKEELIGLLGSECFGKIKKARNKYLAHYAIDYDKTKDLNINFEDIENAIIIIGKIIYKLNLNVRNKDISSMTRTQTKIFKNLSMPFVSEEQAKTIEEIYNKSQSEIEHIYKNK